ncbi:MAG TPA: hypothetical protein VFE31_01365 [Opitutaceae bacterium]|nr:hypothetical protein [Opitutaceae bacterium]
MTPRIAACSCRTAFGDAEATGAALLAGRRALALAPVLGAAGGDPVPLARCGGRALDEAAPPEWLPILDGLAREIPEGPWGEAGHPVFLTSSNFGVGSLHAYQQSRDTAHLRFGTPFLVAELLRARFGWGPDLTLLSHACVSAHLGLLAAERRLRAGTAERALIFSFDFISPFVTAGFHALKILNGAFPEPYAERPTGAIGLGDGAAFAVLAATGGGPAIRAQALYNEMHHFTANRPDGAGFDGCLAPLRPAAAGRRLWIKGHGTGTLEAGRLEAQTLARLFPDAPLVSWKGSLGHTLGSCGLVELAVALAAVRSGRIPGTVATQPPCCGPTVALDSFPAASCDAFVLASNAFGGAHAAVLVSHD